MEPEFRGPLAGPVIAGAVILDPDKPIEGLRDSKRLSASRRDELFDQIRERALAWAVGRADVELAMSRAVEALQPSADHALIDGNRCPDLSCTSQAIIKGDSKVPAISAASIMAKVTRDREMLDLDMRYPGYGLAQHKGYPSKAHIEALEKAWA